MNKKGFFLPVILLLLLIAGCIDEKYSNIDGIIAEPTVALPLAKVSFNIEDVIESDSVIKVGADNMISIKYRRDSVAAIRAMDFLNDFKDLWSFSYTDKQTLGDIELPNQSGSGFFSLKAVVDEFPNPTVRQFFQLNDGQTITTLPFDEAIDYDIGIPEFTAFKKVTIKSGKLVLKGQYDFPFPIEDVIFEIFDNVSGDYVDQLEIQTLLPGQAFELETDLSGKTINNWFFIKMRNMKSPGSNGAVPLDLEARLSITAEAKELIISSGEVKVPQTDFPSVDEMIDIQPDNGIKITNSKVASGTLDFEIKSDINLPVEVNIELPTALKNGTPLTKTFMINGQTSSGSISLDGYDIDLGTDSNQPYNQFPIVINTSTNGSGSGMVIFTSTDEIEGNFDINDLVIENFVGNAGSYQETLTPGSFDFGLDFGFLDPESQAAFMEDPRIELFYQNSFGVPIESTFGMEATGTFGATQSLNPPKFVLNHPPLSQIGNSVNGNFELNKDNSDLVDFLSIFPERVDYSGEVFVNPLNNNDLDNYITLESRVQFGVDVDLPVSFKASKLVFRDTFSNEPLGDNPEEVQSLVLVLDYRNDLPFATNANLIGISTDGNTIKILDDLLIESAKVDANGKSIETTSGRIEIPLDRSQIDAALLSETLTMKVSLSTADMGQNHVSLFSTDGIELGLAARIELKID